MQYYGLQTSTGELKVKRYCPFAFEKQMKDLEIEILIGEFSAKNCKDAIEKLKELLKK